ncbi:MAG: glycosyltransferase [Bacteroidales bacterium]|nr:glycosyltransferase [Bacteroidales bacterium]
MTVLCFAIVFLAYCYTILILYSLQGWNKKNKQTAAEHSYPFCSVVIAARNEEKNISQTIQSLANQSYPADCFEILVIDDHSTDSTKAILDQLCSCYTNLSVCTAPDTVTGKKQALRHLLQSAKGDYIFFTDADCLIQPKWIESYIAYTSNNKGNLFFGNVIPAVNGKSSFIEKCVALDFIGILGVQNGLAKNNHTFSCNGANMCITKDFYKQHYKTNENYSSGDDVFLLHTAKKIDKQSVHFIQDFRASVTTKVPSSIKQFINQRIRWASKAGGYKDFDSIFVALTVYIYCFAMTLTAILACFGIAEAGFIFIFLFLTKSVSDMLLFIKTKQYFQSGKYVWYAVPLQLFYHFYISLIPVFSLIHPAKWKNREIR